MSSETQQPRMNGSTSPSSPMESDMEELNQRMGKAKYLASFHGDHLIGDQVAPTGFAANLQNNWRTFRSVLSAKNALAISKLISQFVQGKGVELQSAASVVGSIPNDSNWRAAYIRSAVKDKYNKMLHPPLTYLGDAFQYRTADGKFNSVLVPRLGQAGAPYAKTVPSKTHPLGALPAAGDIFDRLMAREEGGRESPSGLSSMLIYHATIIIHDIFRTNASDKNISDSSSYLDLSPLYGYTDTMQRQVRDGRYKFGLLKPDTFAEDRLLRQPPGVCIILVMYNRYHNFAARQLYRINENGRFSVPRAYSGAKIEAMAAAIAKQFQVEMNQTVLDAASHHAKVWEHYQGQEDDKKATDVHRKAADAVKAAFLEAEEDGEKRKALEAGFDKARAEFEKAYDAAWNKLDDDLFNTARLITCGMYVQISIHDYLRALMGFHQFDTDFTLDPRSEIDHKNVSRGLGNQVTVEFNLLYRFHCAISLKDERYIEDFTRYSFAPDDPKFDPKNVRLNDFVQLMEVAGTKEKVPPWEQTFGLPNPDRNPKPEKRKPHPQPELDFQRHPITGLFNDKQMMDQLLRAMDDPISNFGPRNTPRALRNVEILGITQARKWEVGTLNDFREFFGMKRHETFESMTKNFDMQNALRDLYEHPDKVELYPGIFCESDADLGLDPGPREADSALWAAIFSDAITLVRSDRFYTVDWNTNSLTSWGMKEVTADSNICKGSVFHRLIQRAFPEWFPYDSIRFFHPFYTAQTNAKYAYQQAYAADFRMQVIPDLGILGQTIGHEFDVARSNPNKPVKPKYLSSYKEIQAVLTDPSGRIVHPARLERHNLPPQMAQVLSPEAPPTTGSIPEPEGMSECFERMNLYFTKLMHDIVVRESITMDKKRPVYQIDVIRDLAIPVTVRYVVDFLGFGDKVRSETNLNAPYSENEIYQHITNCQTFLSYNVDETKLLKRRTAYNASMKFLYQLTKSGNVLEASKWPVTRVAGSFVEYLGRMGRTRPMNPMKELGFLTAQQVLRKEKDFGRSAAILTLIALDIAFNAVLASTSALDTFIKDLHTSAAETPKADPSTCTWRRIQRLAFKDCERSATAIEQLVVDAQRKSVKLPLIRKAVQDVPELGVSAGQTIICDIWKAEMGNKSGDPLAYRSAFTDQYAAYHPKDLAKRSLVAMIRTLAQMKNLRRGHDAQGLLKRIDFDASYEGYSNFMAPGRMKKIEFDAKNVTEGKASEVWTGYFDSKKNNVEEGTLKELEAEKITKRVTLKEAEAVFSKRVLKPEVGTYLTPEWDEFVPFPNTWKLRFEGFGRSEYPELVLTVPQTPPLPDDVPPFYQPQGVSHTGGTFEDAICACKEPGKVCLCVDPIAHAAAEKDIAARKASRGEASGEVLETPAEAVRPLSTGCMLPG